MLDLHSLPFSSTQADRGHRLAPGEVLGASTRPDDGLNGAPLSTRRTGQFLTRFPQFVLAIIAPPRNATLDTIDVKAELDQVKKQKIDITDVESEFDDFKSAFGRNHDLAKPGSTRRS